jgi:SAM-dependent methyltransferase
MVSAVARPPHERDPVGRFDGRAADYARWRPDYPAAAFDAMLEGLPPGSAVADVGAGTGIASRALAERGCRVFAVEPNAAMRGAALPGAVEWRDATAEATGLADGSVRLVLCAQSFHWFDPSRALPEFRRILAPSGRLALLWNVREEADAFTAAYGRIVREAAGPDADIADRAFRAEAEVRRHFRGLRLLAFPHRQSLDVEGLLGRALSTSYVPRHGPARDRLVAALRDLAGPGTVTLVYRTELWLADRP